MRFFIFKAILFTLLLNSAANAQKLGVLPDIEKPVLLFSDSSRIYVTEKDKICIYDINDLRLVKKFGRTGTRNGEFRLQRGSTRSIMVDVSNGLITVTTEGRMSVFNNNGDFIKELEIHPQIDTIRPYKNMYISSAYYIRVGTGKSEEYFTIHTHGEEDMTLNREFYRSGLGQGTAMGLGTDGDFDIALFPSTVGFQISGDNIIIGDAAKGFYFAIYDLEGNLKKEIEKDFVRVPVSETMKNLALDKYKQRAIYKKYSELIEFEIPEYLPGFRDFKVYENKIFVYLFSQNEKSRTVRILDLSGNELGSYEVPLSDHSTFQNDKYFYLKKNRFNEWEIFVHDLSNKLRTAK